MYADNTLTPKEATRLCALGMLAGDDMTYASLAAGVRYFVTHVMGPSLEVMGTSIELLKHEGLVTTVVGSGDDSLLSITSEGRSEFKTLLTANIKTSENDLNKLVIALKFRFMDDLDAEDRHTQIDLLVHAVDNELARLEELRAHHANEGGHLIDWLDRELEDLESRRTWLNSKRDQL